MFADQRRRTVDLDHGESAPGRRNRITLVRMRLLSNAQRIQLRLKSTAIYNVWRRRFPLHHSLPMLYNRTVRASFLGFVLKSSALPDSRRALSKRLSVSWDLFSHSGHFSTF